VIETVWWVLLAAFVGLIILNTWSRYGGGDGGDHL
jgi:hypothetical protein